jgi:hypothetical protein
MNTSTTSLYFRQLIGSLPRGKEVIRDMLAADISDFNTRIAILEGLTLAPVATYTALKALDTTDIQDGSLVTIEDTGSLYRFNLGETTGSEDPPETYDATDGGGVWHQTIAQTIAIHDPVGTIANLKAIPAAERSNGMLCGVTNNGAGVVDIYRFKASDATAESLPNVVAPTAGTGRWFALRYLLTSSFETAGAVAAHLLAFEHGDIATLRALVLNTAANVAALKAVASGSLVAGARVVVDAVDLSSFDPGLTSIAVMYAWDPSIDVTGYGAQTDGEPSVLVPNDVWGGTKIGAWVNAALLVGGGGIDEYADVAALKADANHPPVALVHSAGDSKPHLYAFEAANMDGESQDTYAGNVYIRICPTDIIPPNPGRYVLLEVRTHSHNKTDIDNFESNVRLAEIADVGGAAGEVVVMVSNPVDGNTFTLGAQTYEFDDNASVLPGNIAVTIGVDEDATATNFAAAINGSSSHHALAVAAGGGKPTYVLLWNAYGTNAAISSTGAWCGASHTNLNAQGQPKTWKRATTVIDVTAPMVDPAKYNGWFPFVVNGGGTDVLGQLSDLDDYWVERVRVFDASDTLKDGGATTAENLRFGGTPTQLIADLALDLVAVVATDWVEVTVAVYEGAKS